MLEWARGSLAPIDSVKPGTSWHDLAPLDEMIGDASVVALSEGAHGAAEPLEFRNRLLQYLVQHKGFTAIAIESGIVEGHVVHDYVRGGPGDLDAVLAQGITWNFDRFPQNRALVRWLRDYNADPRHPRKVNFYGFDGPGAPSRHRANFTYYTALDAVLQFLARADATAASVFRARLGPAMQYLGFHPRVPIDPPCYGTMTQSERDALTAAIADLVTWLDRHEARYSAVSSADEYAWACRSAIGARQLDNWLRQVPAAWTPSGVELTSAHGPPPFFAAIQDVRDRALADNVEWIVNREGASGKVLVFAARYHLSAAPLTATLHPHRQEREHEVAGTYLRRRFGRQLLTIGNLIGSGEVAGSGAVLGRAPSDSLDGVAAELGVPLYLLDLRRAPPDVARWLDEEHRLAAGSQVLKLRVRQAFDILFYIDAVTPALESAALAREA